MLSQKIPGGNELLNPEKILKDELGLTPASYVGDFGCGATGYFAMQAAKISGESGLVYVVDILKNNLSSVEKHGLNLDIKNIKTIWADLEKFGACKINNNTLDFGLLINVLFQNKNKKEILKEVSRTIKQGGKLLVIDWKEGRFPLGPMPENKISPEKLIEFAKELNLKLERKFEAGQYHFGIIFVK